MATQETDNSNLLDTLLVALSSSTRRKILERIVRQPASVAEIVAMVPVSQPAVSQHLKSLRQAGLVEEERRGRQVIYSAKLTVLAPLTTYLEGLIPPESDSMSISGKSDPDRIDDAMKNWSAPGLLYDIDTVSTIVRLNLLAERMDHLFSKTSESHGITRGDSIILGTLRRLGGTDGLTPSDIANAALHSKPDISRRLIRLENAGLIARKRSDGDQRSHFVSLTLRGEKIIDAIIDHQFSVAYRPFFEVSVEQRRLFDQVLRDLDKKLEKA